VAQSGTMPSDQGWPRRRGVVAAVVAIAVVVLALILSRLDLASELNVIRGDLAATTADLQEAEAELDRLEEEASGIREDLDACRQAAELTRQVQDSLDRIIRGGEGQEQGLLAAVVRILEMEEEWRSANDRCIQATQAAGG
jgi:septal ring factor EnvC (AmiA/AmiB activator)